MGLSMVLFMYIVHEKYHRKTNLTYNYCTRTLLKCFKKSGWRRGWIGLPFWWTGVQYIVCSTWLQVQPAPVACTPEMGGWWLTWIYTVCVRRTSKMPFSIYSYFIGSEKWVC